MFYPFLREEFEGGVDELIAAFLRLHVALSGGIHGAISLIERSLSITSSLLSVSRHVKLAHWCRCGKSVCGRDGTCRQAT
jgi:hypothetical protein